MAGILFCPQGAILTTMLATRNFSSKYDAQGKYLRPSSALHGPRQTVLLYLPLNFYAHNPTRPYRLSLSFSKRHYRLYVSLFSPSNPPVIHVSLSFSLSLSLSLSLCTYTRSLFIYSVFSVYIPEFITHKNPPRLSSLTPRLFFL